MYFRFLKKIYLFHVCYKHHLRVKNKFTIILMVFQKSIELQSIFLYILVSFNNMQIQGLDYKRI